MNKSGQITESGYGTKNYVLFSLGDFGYQCVFFWATAFLTIFYTDIFLIPAGAVSVLMLIVRLYDAINDPIIGSLQDKSKSKMGRYRPFVVIGAIGLGISIVFMFWAHPTWSTGAKIAYMYITYIIVVTFSTMFYMAYGALNGVISTSPMERAKFSSSRFMATNLCACVISFVSASALALFSSQVTGYVVCLLVCAVIGVPMMCIAGVSSKEVIGPKENQKKIKMSESFKALFQNKALLIIVFNMFVYGFQFTIRMSAATFFFTYNVGNFALFSIYSALGSILGMFGAYAAPKLYAKIGNKGRVAAYVMFATAILLVIQFFVPATGGSIYIHYILAALSGFSLGVYPAMIYGMVPDATDLSELKNDIRIDGFCNSIVSFGWKAGGAIAAAVTTAILDASGYVPNVAQSNSTLNMIRVMLCIIPAVIAVVAGVTLMFYKLDNKRHAEIREMLREKNYQ